MQTRQDPTKGYLKSTYIALDDLQFDWIPSDVEKFDELWNDGRPISDIASEFGRDVDEVALLAMDRARKEMIQPRERGVFGI